MTQPSSVALLAEGVDRNLCVAAEHEWDLASPSSRRAWIEISSPTTTSEQRQVALLAEGVDRNLLMESWYSICSRVALLAEGVDRNRLAMIVALPASVALLAEGVDRNQGVAAVHDLQPRSPSSRRAWIEMVEQHHEDRSCRVALLAEGVDRNLYS